MSAIHATAEEQLHEALQALREKEAFNFALFQHNPLAITVVDRNLCVVKSNLARRNAPDPLPRLGEPLFAQDGKYDTDMAAELRAAINAGTTRTCPDVRAGDSIYHFTIAPFPHGAIVLRQDITAAKAAEAQLVQAQKLAALGTLVTGVAHEVSNPNNVMLLSTRSLTRLVDDLMPLLDELREERGDFEIGAQSVDLVRDDLQDLVASCRRAAERIDRLVDDLKDFARREDRVARDPVDVNRVVHGATALMGATIRKATRNFNIEPAEGVPPVRGSARRLEQVVINLVTNACQALTSPEEGIWVSTAYAPDDHTVRISVRDEGPGIGAAQLARITDPFFTTRHDTGGTGLGLSISRQIVESHGGRLAFTSRPGQGTTAMIILPAEDTP